MAERQTIIPRSEAELAKANIGDLVKLSCHGSKGFKSYWGMYNGLSEGKDYFKCQGSVVPGRPAFIEIHSSPRRTLQFDKSLGVIINYLLHDVEVVFPTDLEYPKLVHELKQAGLWQELIEIG